jgi:hypothetical protein
MNTKNVSLKLWMNNLSESFLFPQKLSMCVHRWYNKVELQIGRRMEDQFYGSMVTRAFIPGPAPLTASLSRICQMPMLAILETPKITANRFSLSTKYIPVKKISIYTI